MTAHRLVRATAYKLNFVLPILCRCGDAHLYVIDHRHPRHDPTASRDLRYEVTCDACFWCDADGYRTRAELLAAYDKPLTPPEAGSE